MQVEQELSRQAWLRAFGLSPWTAHTRLPGAAHLPLVEFLPVTEETTPATGSRPASDHATQPAAQPTQAAANPHARPTAPDNSTSDGNASAPRPAVSPKPTQPLAPALPLLAARGAAATHINLPNPVLRLAADTLLVTAQQDAGAPEMTAAEQRLLQSLMQLFGQPTRDFPFPCPLDATEAQEALTAFVGGLTRQGCKRVLFCLDSDACQHLAGDLERYKAFTFAGLPALAISSIGDMLATPVEHKRRSWQAMQTAGFALSASNPAS